jgi:hypothetical protein
MRYLTTLPASLLAALMVTACADDPTGAALLPPAEPAMAATLDEMAMYAASVGDDRAATAFAGGALALRFGIEPTELILKIDGVDTRYLGVVTGFAEPANPGGVGIRSLVAWTTPGAPAAFLQVDARSDAAAFDPTGAPMGPGLAKGSWADIAAQERHVAEDGSSYTSLTSLAGRCPNQPAGTDPRVVCTAARFSARLEGTFVSLSQPSERVTIAVPQQGVAGALLQRQGGGDPVRPPTARPGRPLPQPGR